MSVVDGASLYHGGKDFYSLLFSHYRPPAVLSGYQMIPFCNTSTEEQVEQCLHCCAVAILFPIGICIIPTFNIREQGCPPAGTSFVSLVERAE